MQPRETLLAVAGQGLDGDAAFGNARRQVLLIDLETLREFGLPAGSVRENITTEGLPLQGLARGTRLRIQDVVLEVTGDCTPCGFLDSLRPGLRQALAGKRGLLASVVRGGMIRVGAPIGVAAAPEPAEASVRATG